MTPPAVHSLTLPSMMSYASQQAVVNKMRLTFNGTRRTLNGVFALGASNVHLVGENPTCPVPALQKFEGLWPRDYGHA